MCCLGTKFTVSRCLGTTTACVRCGWGSSCLRVVIWTTKCVTTANNLVASRHACTCRLGPLPLVCKRFQRLLLDPRDRHLWSELELRADGCVGVLSDTSHQRFLAFLRSHLHQVEVATLVGQEVRSTDVS